MNAQHIVISGASGLIGRALVPHLQAQGHVVRRLVRREVRSADEILWQPESGKLQANELKGVTAVIHLAGANVAGGRWTRKRRALIRDSRVLSTRTLVRAIGELDQKPQVFISASAAGWYGDHGEETLSETSASGTGFLAGVCRDWENEIFKGEYPGLRTVALRLGVVLSPKGGALGKMLPVFRAGLGGRLGNGRQWMSWVAVDDLLRIVDRALADGQLRGPVNAVSPQPVRNAAFAATLASILQRPCVLAVPEFMLRLLFGEMACETVLASSRVRPDILTDSGFVFEHPELDGALRHLLAR